MPTNDIVRLTLNQRSFLNFLKAGIRTFGLAFLDFPLAKALAVITNVIYRGDPYRFGLRESLVFSRRIAQWLRNAAVARVIQEEFPSGCRVLDVGGTSWGIRFFLSPDRYGLTVVNLSFQEWPHRLRNVNTIHASGYSLPFRERAFEVVVCIDTLEHIRPDRREQFLREIKRVAETGYVLCPVEDGSGKYVASACDRYLASILLRRLGFIDHHLQDHLHHGVPTLEELVQLGLELKGGALNASAWRAYVPLGRLPLAGFISGLLYLCEWRRLEGEPPYYSAIFRLSERA